MKISRLRLWVLTASIGLVNPSHAQTFPSNPFGDLLPGLRDLPIGNDKIQNGAALTETVDQLVGTAANGTTTSGPGGQNTVDSNAYCDGMAVGTMHFQFGGVAGTFTDNGDPGSGMLMRGGFSLGSGTILNPGHTLGWLQIFTETGRDGFDYTSRVDVPPGSDPMYHEFVVPGTSTGSDWSGGLYDNPFHRTFGNHPLSNLEFESAFYCLDAGSKNFEILGSMVWGMNFETDPQSHNYQNVTSTYGYKFTPFVDQNFLDTVQRDFGKDGWTVTVGCDDCFAHTTPEPTTVIPFATMAIALIARRRRRSTEVSDDRR